MQRSVRAEQQGVNEALLAQLASYRQSEQFFVALTLGQQRWVSTLGLDHGEVLGDNLTGVANAVESGV